MKHAKLHLSVTFHLLLLSAPCAVISFTQGQEKSIPDAKTSNSVSTCSPIEVVGYGVNEQEATKDALINSVAQVVGALCYSETRITNDETFSKVNLLSNGFVKSYQHVSTNQKNGLFTVKIIADVQQGNVADFIKRRGIETKTDLRDQWATLSSSIHAKKQALDLYQAKVGDIADNLFEARIVDPDTGKSSRALPEPYVEEDLDGNARCLWVMKMEPDITFWNECAYPLLEACFKTLCIGYKTIDIQFGPAERAAYFVFKNSTNGVTTPQFLPPLLRIKSPNLRYLSGDSDPGLHPALFGEQKRPFQGQLVWEQIGGLHVVILQKISSTQGATTTAYFFNKEVFDRLQLQDNVSIELNASLRLKNGENRSFSQKDTIMHGAFATKIKASSISSDSGPVYFGPYTQAGLSSDINQAGQSRWPVWRDLSVFESHFSGFYALHQKRLYPISTNFGDQPPPFLPFWYLPLYLKIPVDEMPNVAGINLFLKLQQIKKQQ